jgi:hypothetical protein
MEWGIIGILGVFVLLLIKIYRVALKENRDLANLTMLLALEEELYVTHKNALIKFAASAQAKNAAELATKAYMAIGKVASEQNAALLVMGALWKIRTGA